eukprot:TRINITY_DN3023_c0_g4_i1.p4 TRINITY_DN3023_c0_g4~~TRINITY_DN3023_c0_g4_i1.p4  ORF type:complete len:192 (+),score=17.14 TRINITY_DN3023_c0_g4_i1:1282-1857(+)
MGAGVVDPATDDALRFEIELLELARGVDEGSGGGALGDESVNVDANMVVVDILELEVADGVELESYDMVAGAAVAFGAEEAEVLTGKPLRKGGGRRRHDEGKAMAAEGGIHGRDGDSKVGAEGVRELREGERTRVKCATDEALRAVGQLEDAAGVGVRDALREERRLLLFEAIVDEVGGLGAKDDEKDKND